MKELLEKYVPYNNWANSLMLQTIQNKAHDKIDLEVKSSFPSIRKTLYHIWGAELVWLKRLYGESLDNLPKPADLKNLEELLEPSAQFVGLIEDKTDDYFHEICEYKNTKGQAFSNLRGWMIMHCMNHSTFHRGQLVTMLREVGITEIPATDLIAYLRI